VPSLHPQLALPRYAQALALDSTSYPALWRVARAYVDIAKQIEGKADSVRRRRDSLFQLARGLAERAIRADSLDADGHFVLALALGRLSLPRSGKERVRFGRAIYDEAARAVALRPDHDGAHHILGEWHAEVRRLSGVTRFFAKALFGGGFLDRASFDSATAHLERAVALRPTYIYHRLQLALVYMDVDRPADAIRELEAIKQQPDSDVLDPRHRRRAEALLRELITARSVRGSGGAGASARP
jgi:tetratricopeptide (TPR) repeat protein